MSFGEGEMDTKRLNWILDALEWEAYDEVKEPDLRFAMTNNNTPILP